MQSGKYNGQQYRECSHSSNTLLLVYLLHYFRTYIYVEMADAYVSYFTSGVTSWDL